MTVPTGCMTITEAGEKLGWTSYLVRWCMHQGFLKTKKYYVQTRRGRKQCKAVVSKSVEELRVRVLNGTLKGMV